MLRVGITVESYPGFAGVGEHSWTAHPNQIMALQRAAAAGEIAGVSSMRDVLEVMAKAQPVSDPGPFFWILDSAGRFTSPEGTWAWVRNNAPILRQVEETLTASGSKIFPLVTRGTLAALGDAGQALLKLADAEVERGLPRERGLGRAWARFRRRARLKPAFNRTRESEGGGEDEADGKPGDRPQRQFAVEETAVALHLLGPAHAMTVQPFAVTLQLLLRGGNDAA